MCTSAKHCVTPQGRIILELFFLDRLSTKKRFLVAGLVVLTSIALGIVDIALQTHFATQLDAGQPLTTIPHLFATGSTWITSWVGWAAAGCFLLASYNVRFGHADPPYGTDANSSARATREGVRREYRWVRLALAILSATSLAEIGRVGTLVVGVLTNVTYASTQAPVVVVEAAGVCSATAVLALWAYWFRKRLDQWSAI